MITLEEFATLGCGSVLLFPRRTVGPVYRTVVVGPADHEDPSRINCCMLPIMHRSWTRRGYACISYFDMRDREVSLTRKKTDDIMSKEEIFRLLSWHSKPSELLEKEIKEGRIGPYWNPIKNPLQLCKKLREMRNSLRWASI